MSDWWCFRSDYTGYHIGAVNWIFPKYVQFTDNIHSNHKAGPQALSFHFDCPLWISASTCWFGNAGHSLLSLKWLCFPSQNNNSTAFLFGLIIRCACCLLSWSEDSFNMYPLGIWQANKLILSFLRGLSARTFQRGMAVGTQRGWLLSFATLLTRRATYRQDPLGGNFRCSDPYGLSWHSQSIWPLRVAMHGLHSLSDPYGLPCMGFTENLTLTGCHGFHRALSITCGAVERSAMTEHLLVVQIVNPQVFFEVSTSWMKYL